MDKNRKIEISVIITTFSEFQYLDKLLDNLSKQKFSKEKFEVLVLEAGSYPASMAKKIFNKRIKNFKFIYRPGLSRIVH